MKRSSGVNVIGLVIIVALFFGCTTYVAEYRETMDGKETTTLIIKETTTFGKSVLNGNGKAIFDPKTGRLTSLGLGTESQIDASKDAEALRNGLLFLGSLYTGVPMRANVAPLWPPQPPVPARANISSASP